MASTFSPRITRRSFVCGLSAAPFAARPAFAGKGMIFTQDGIAIQGIDPVGYFTQARPVQGVDQFRLQWRHAIWQFASRHNMSTFERNPHRFAPRYGGFCAMSMSQGQISDSTPEAWSIHNGRLYLARSIAAIEQWQHDPATYAASADSYWTTASWN